MSGTIFRRRSPGRVLAGCVGAFAFLAAWRVYRALRRALGAGGPPWVKVRRSIEVNAPVEVVFDYWKHFSNFSRFMSFVREVRVNERGGFDWTIAGPGGAELSWESVVRRLVPDQGLAWGSLPNAWIRNEGDVRFRSGAAGGTVVDVSLAFAPPAGFLGYGVIRLLGFDPRARIEGDLRRMKALVEAEAGAAGSARGRIARG